MPADCTTVMPLRPVSGAMRLLPWAACALLLFAAPAAAAGAAKTTATAGATPTKPAPTSTSKDSSSSASDAEKTTPLGSGFDKAMKTTKAPGGKSKGTTGGGGGASSSTAGRMIFGLLLVLALIYGIHWLLKKYGQGKGDARFPGGGGSTDAIEVMATTPLAAGRSLHLVRVGTEMVLIGATEQSINQLGTVDAHQLAVAAGNAGDTEFHQTLQGALNGTSSSMQKDDDTFLRRFVANLQLMTSR
jgi:flagellar biosynthetic protein FliO